MKHTVVQLGSTTVLRVIFLEFSVLHWEVPRLAASAPAHRKFSNDRANNLIPPDVAGSDAIKAEAKILMSNALSKASWSKYRVAEKHFKEFLSENELVCSWPIKAEEARGFTVWLLRVKKLSVNTVKEYLSGLRSLHVIQGFNTAGLEDETTKKLIEGARNLEWLDSKKQSGRRAMSVPLMKLLKIEIFKSSLTILEKSAMWAACTVAFQAALRMGEILTSNSEFFDPQTVLLNRDIEKKDGIFTIHIKSPKIKSRGGDFVEVFPTDGVLCPVKALDDHVTGLANNRLFFENKPVMTISPRSFLSTGRVNELLKVFLGKHIDLEKHPISCHSFRAGVPTLVQSSSRAETINVKAWGRWRSSAVDTYKKLDRKQRAIEFEKIRPLLND